MSKQMTEGKPLGLLVRFAIPLMMSNAFQLIYNVADGAVIGRLIGVSAFAAVSAGGFLYWFVLSTILGFAQGFGAIFAQRFGAKDEDGLRKAIVAASFLTLVLGVCFTAAGVLLARPILVLLNTPADILDDTVLYVGILLAGILVTFTYNLFGTLFRAIGDAKTPLVAMIFSCLINIALDIILVLITPWGVGAVALATVLAQLFACAFCFRKALKFAPFREANWRKIDWPMARELLRMGGPIGLQNSVTSLGGAVVQYVVNGYGTLFVAGIAAPKKLYGIMTIIGDAIEGAIATFVAQNYGAGKLDRIKSGVLSAVKVLMISTAVIAVVLFFFGRQVLGLLISGDTAEVGAVLDVAVRQLNIMLLLLPFLFLLTSFRASIQGMGNSLIPMLSGFAELIVRSSSALFLPALIGEWGVYFAESLGWPVLCIGLGITLVAVYRRRAAAERARLPNF